MGIFNVSIEEHLLRTITIKAKDEDKAIEKAKEMYYAREIILGQNDRYVNTEFEVIEEIGYEWDGIIKISIEEAEEQFWNGERVYLLFPDGTEALANCWEHVQRHVADCGELGIIKQEGEKK